MVARPSAETQPGGPTPVPSRYMLRGVLGGALGGISGGALGGALGGSIEAMARPALHDALVGAAVGALAWGVPAAAVGAPFGWLAGRLRGKRGAFVWPLVGAFFAVLVSAVETSQAGAARGALAFALSVPLMAGLCLADSWLAPRVWKLRWVLLGWLVLCLVGEGYGWLFPRPFTALSPPPDETVVQLRYATLPGVLGYISVHYWFLEYD